MRNKTAALIVFLFLGLVILPGFTMSSDGSETPTMGCGQADELEDWLDGDNVAHVYFSQVDPLFEGKDDGEAWAKMSYTYCGIPSRFVFNGHGLEGKMPYALIASPVMPGMILTPTAPVIPLMLGESMSNDGGNVHIKGALPAEEGAWDLYLVRADMWNDVILAADESTTWTMECYMDNICDEGVLLAQVSGEAQVPPVMTEASGNAIFYDNGTRDQLAFILQASDIGTVIGAHIHYGATGSNGPAVAALFSGADNSGDFLIAGMVMGAGLMGDFGGSPVSALIAAMDDGMAYVNVHTETWPAGEIRGQIERVDISGYCHDDDDDWDDDCDDDCVEVCRQECLENCLEKSPECSIEDCKDICKVECKEVCKNDVCDDECEATVEPEDPYYERFEGMSFDNSCEVDEDCVVGGCSGEVCAAESATTTCEVLPYLPEGGCLCVEGVCQWTVCSD